MFDIDRWSEIWASISSNKLRTSLSGITISLALFVFIFLFGLGNGLQNGFEKEFFKSNAFNIEIYANRTSEAYAGYQKGREIVLENKDVKIIQNNYSPQIKHISGKYSQLLKIKQNGESGSYSVSGVATNYQNMIAEEIIKGRFFNTKEEQAQQKVAVIGRLVAKDFFKNTNPLGQYLQMGTGVYEIVGVFSSESGDNAEREIYIPLSTLQTIYATDDLSGITLAPIDDLSLDEIAKLSKNITTTLKSVHKINPIDETAIRVFDASEGMGATNTFLLVITIIVLVIGGGSLIAGIVSIGNIMVFSVKERTKEIGIRKALGATPLNVIGLIMQEAVLLTLLFGAFGILLATILVESIGDSLQDYFIYNPGVSTESLVIACVILFLAGFLAGFIPARNAAKIKPIDALRDE